MKDNANLKIVGNKVILIPYEAKHVSKYHGWMENEELRTLTASERLSLEEEYDMQRTWRECEDKCCFLIMCKENYEMNGDEIASLIGDTNLYLTREQETQNTSAEIEIMIAEPEAQGKGYGQEATVLMLWYGLKYLNVNLFFAKIGMDNYKSLRMFKKLQFAEEERSEVFQEVTMKRTITPDWTQWLNKECYTVKLSDYHE